MQTKLAIGRVLSPHGLKGEVVIESFSGEYSHIRSQQTVFLHLADREVEQKIVHIRGANKRRIISFEGIDSPQRAKIYNGARICVDRNHAAVLGNGEYYFTDLINCKLIVASTVHGVVTSVWENQHCDMLEVRRNDGRVVQVPLQDYFVAQVDVANKIIELNMDWILE